jgi:hypothetical protein
MPRDYLGTLASLSLATNGTDVASADSIKFDAIHARSRFSKHHTGVSDPDAVACFQPTADFASIDSFTPYIEDSADGSTWYKIAQGGRDDIGLAPKASQVYEIPIPKTHRARLRLGATPYSSGTFSARTLQCWFGHGEGRV